MIVVSHDRYFLDRTVRRIFAFEEGGRIRQYEGGWSDYQAARQLEEKEAPGRSWKNRYRKKGKRSRGGRGAPTVRS